MIEYANTLTIFITDKEVMRKTGQIVFTTDVAAEYGFNDIDGT